MNNADEIITKRISWIASVDWVLAALAIIGSGYFIMTGDVGMSIGLAVCAIVSATVAYTKLAERIARALVKRIIAKKTPTPNKGSRISK
jgi:uncharacterized membrane protein